MTRTVILFPLLFLSACAINPSPTPNPPSDRFGSFPRATLHGRIVDANGNGVGGLEIVASTFDEGWGENDFGDVVGVTASDGTWSWQAPQMANLTLQFRKPGLLWLGAGTAWLRPEKSYDLGTRVLPSTPVTIRLTDPHGISLTRLLSPDAIVDEEGWTTVLVEDVESLWHTLLFSLTDTPTSEERLERALRGEPLDLETSAVRAIVQVTYPDRAPVKRAVVYWGYDRYLTDDRGEVILCEANEPRKDADTLQVTKGDYSRSLDLDAAPGSVVAVELPRGGDVEIELAPATSLPLAPLGFMADPLDAAGELTAEPSHFVGRFIGIVENIAPGTRRIHCNLVYGDEWITPGEFSVEVRRGELTKKRIELRPQRSRPLEVRVIDAAKFPIEGAAVDFGPQRAITDTDGRVTLTKYDQERQPDIVVEHPTLGYVELDSKEFSEGPITLVLQPWCRLGLQVIDQDGASVSSAKVEVSPNMSIIHVRHFEDEIPWYSRWEEGAGSVELSARHRSYNLTARANGWWRTGTVSLRDGERAKTIRWPLPPLREIRVRFVNDGAPAEGEVSGLFPAVEGWTFGGLDLDRDGEIVLHTPALDPSTPITIQWLDRDRGERRQWTVPIDGSATLTFD